VVSATQQRAAAEYLAAAFDVSQRRAGQVLGRARSTLRYRRQPRSGEDALVRALRRLARRHPRFGYKRIHARLRHQGWRVNLKRTRRLWIALGLRRPFRRKKPRKLGRKLGSSANSCTNQPARFKNDVWTCDFIVDRTAEGGTLKCLSVVDEYTRECLLLHMAGTLTGADVRRQLTRVVARRGAPTRLRSDNGSEFLGEALTCWLPRAGTQAIPVAPAHPWENGFIESFHSRLRDEFLEREEFTSVADARERARWWRREYNTIRPHSGIGYKTPKDFRRECDEGLHGLPPLTRPPNVSACVNGTAISGGPKNG
jgi:putative transposase